MKEQIVRSKVCFKRIVSQFVCLTLFGRADARSTGLMPLFLFLLCSGNTNLRVSGDWVEIPKHFSTLSVEVTCNATLQTTVCSVGLSLGTSVRPSESRINVSSYSEESATPGHLLHCS